MNAVKNGMRARTLVLPGESQEDFAQLLRIKTQALKPRDDQEDRLVYRAASAHWVLERAGKVLHARLASQIEGADELIDDYIYICCKKLFWDCRGSLATYALSDRKSTRLNSSHCVTSRMPSSA